MTDWQRRHFTEKGLRTTRKLEVGMAVRHRRRGHGKVVKIEGDVFGSVLVKFEDGDVYVPDFSLVGMKESK